MTLGEVLKRVFWLDVAERVGDEATAGTLRMIQRVRADYVACVAVRERITPEQAIALLGSDYLFQQLSKALER